MLPSNLHLATGPSRSRSRSLQQQQPSAAPTASLPLLFCQHPPPLTSSTQSHNAVTDKRTEFEEEEDPTQKSFFSEIISSISDVKFSKDGRYILSRDYLTLKIWDIAMENKPVKTINIHEHLRSKLCDLYENDCIFDKFECTFSGNGE